MLLQWFLSNSLLIVGALLALIIVFGNKLPSITTWQAFLDSFESKGGQLMLLWVTDFIVLTVLVRYWKGFDAQLQTTIVGLLSGVNGAFLGAVGARPTANTSGIGGTVGPGPLPAADLPPATSPSAPAAASVPAPGTAIGFVQKPIGHVGDRGDHGDLGTNNLRGVS